MKTICITSSDDGQYSVGEHSAYMQEMGGEQSGMMSKGEMTPETLMGGKEEMGEPGMRPAASLDEVLSIARSMLQPEGGEGMGEGMGQEDEMAAAQRGYGTKPRMGM